MSRFIKDWLVSNEEKAEEAPVIVQDGETPEEDFSAASAEIASDVETDKPAVAEIPAASDDDAEHKTEDQGHQTVTVSKEDDEETADEDESVSADKSEAEDDDADSADESGEDDVSAEDDAETKDTVDSETDEGEVVAELEPGEDDPKDDVSEVDGEDGTVEAGGVAEPTGEADTDDDAGEDESGDSDDQGSVDEESESTDSEDASEADAENDDPIESEENDEDASDEPNDNVGVEEYEEEESTLDYPIEAEADAVNEIEQTANDVDALMDVGSSLESYHALLTQSLADEGGISPLTAEMVRVGLESLDVSLGGEAVVLGMESFGIHSSRQMATQISLEGVSTALKSTLDAAKKALTRLFELLYDAWNTAVNGVGKAKKRLAAIKAELKEVPASLPPVETSISGAARLSLDGEFVGNDPATVKLLTNVTSYMYDTYPKSCVAFSKKFMDAVDIDKDDGSGAENERLKVHGLILSSFRTQPWETVDNVDGWKVIGVELPAGWKLERRITDDADVKEIETNEFLKSVKRLSLKDNLKIRFEQSPGSKAGDSTVNYTTPSVGELKAMADALEGLIAVMEKQKTATDQYRKFQETLKNGWQTGYKATLSTTVNQYVDLGRVLTAPAGPYVGYIGRTANGLISVLDHNLKAMKKEAKKQAA